MKQKATAVRKKWTMAILCIMALMMAAPVCVLAAAGSSAKGARLPKYETVKTITVEEDNFSISFKRALAEADENANAKCQYKIVVPPGKYTLTNLLRITSNTWIYAKGATITLSDQVNRVFRTEPNQFYENIKIEGGVWDASKQPLNNNKYDMMFRFSHVKNMILTDMSLKCRRSNHIVEVSDMNGFTVKNCEISGNDNYLQVQPKEALQLDVATKGAMVNCTPYNGKGCHNVLITNNTFSNVSRGLGSHSEAKGAEKNPYTNITIENNTFKNCKGEAIHILYWKNCSVLKNKISKAKHAGIYIESSSANRVENNIITSISAYSGERRPQYGSDRAGILMRKVNSSRITGNKASGCKEIVKQQPKGKKNVLKNNKKK